MYYEDRLQGAGFARVMLSGVSTGSGDVGEIGSSLQLRLGTAVATVDPRAAATLADRITAAPALLDALAPLVGLLVRGSGGGRVIRTNLSTRPFYNESAVRLWLTILAILAVAATLFNGSRVLRYSRSDTALATQASRDEARAAEVRATAVRLRASVDTKQVDAASMEARQANDLIDRRTFSWTELFNRLETTLPPEVRITSVRPRSTATAASR